MKTKYTRRAFMRTAAIASGTLAGGSVIRACSNHGPQLDLLYEQFPVFHGQGYNPANGVAGLLFSMIGYEAGFPVRIVVRLPGKELLTEGAVCKLIPLSGRQGYQSPCSYWGEHWGSHWWVAEFTGIDKPGEWNVGIYDNKHCIYHDTGLKLNRNLLWKQTVELAAVDMLERRVHFTKVGAGWQDAGTLWVESCAQSAMVIALTELVELADERLGQELTNRIYKQITVGSDYLVMTQDKARELGFPPGAMSHDLLGHEKDVLPNDAMKAVIALARSARLLPASYQDRKARYQAEAELTFNWLIRKARPMGNYGLSLFQRGLPDGTLVPADEWQTRDLVTLCWAALELWKLNVNGTKDIAVQFARQIMVRQIPEEKQESGFFGHFLEFDSMDHSEKSWIHGIVNNQFGADIGGIYPNYLMPLIDMIKLWPDHGDAGKWKDTLSRFAYGYLIPACERSPFLIVPQGIFGKEGPIWFCGTFHGTNTIYGYTSALAQELSVLFNESRLREIAYGNLQWLAGLNAGITRENLKACVIFSTDIPEGIALPASMMCGVGKRWAGTWFGTRGVICNGFSTGKQFVYDTEPIQVNDGPFSLTDEDWIPHSAAWLTGLLRLA
jgi:hypothetical protein